MKRTRIINLIALFVNLAIFVAFFAGFYFKFIEPCIKDFNKFQELGTNIAYEFRYYEFTAACITMLASLFMMFANGKSIRRMRDSTPRWIFTLRYISMGMSILVIFSTLVAIACNNGTIQDPKEYVNYMGYKFYWGLAMPSASILLFVLLELEPRCGFRKNFASFIVWCGYSAAVLAFMFILIPKKGLTYVASEFSPYFIFLLTKDLINNQSTWAVTQTITISLFVITTVMSFILPAILRLLNRIFSSLIIGYEYVEIDGEDRVIRPIVYPNKEDKNKNKKKKASKPVHYENVYRLYLNDRKLHNWKVVLPNKSFKIFATQQEALEYASNKARRSKGTVRIHTALAKLKFEEKEFNKQYRYF